MSSRVILAALLALLAPRFALATEVAAVVWERSVREDAVLVRHVHGLVSDLPLTVTEATADRAATLAEQLQGADALAEEVHANVVVWFEPVHGRRPGIMVIVAQPRGGRVFVRRLDTPADSPTLRELDPGAVEAAGLMVRTSLRALCAGGEIGVSRSELPDVPRPPPAPVLPARPALVPAAAAVASPPAARRVTFVSDLGWQASTEGLALQSGIAAGLGVAVGRWSAGMHGAVSFGAERVGAYASYDVARHEVMGYVELSVFERTGVGIAVGAFAGALFLPRHTVATSAGVAPAPASLNPGFAGGLQASVRWLPAALGSRVGPWVLVAADAVPGTPTFGYQVGSTFLSGSSTWPVQPRGEIGIEVRTF
jgi:hypothetical protein